MNHTCMSSWCDDSPPQGMVLDRLLKLDGFLGLPIITLSRKSMRDFFLFRKPEFLMALKAQSLSNGTEPDMFNS